jgi:hypothetical protein
MVDEPTQPKSYFVPPNWLIKQYAEAARVQLSLYDKWLDELPKPPRWKRLLWRASRRWYSARHWLAQKICYISEDLN